MDRRRFSVGVLAAGVSLVDKAVAMVVEPEAFWLKPNDWVPNNPELPVLIYRAAFSTGAGDMAAAMEHTFTRNGWPPQWRNGVYDFHHFHSTAHEVLGFASGEAVLMLGGEGSKTVTVRAGDIALLPVGTGHCRIQASRDFLVVGAYPPGEHWDICRSAPDAAMKSRMRGVRHPATDPVLGSSVAFQKQWPTP